MFIFRNLIWIEMSFSHLEVTRNAIQLSAMLIFSTTWLEMKCCLFTTVQWTTNIEELTFRFNNTEYFHCDCSISENSSKVQNYQVFPLGWYHCNLFVNIGFASLIFIPYSSYLSMAPCVLWMRGRSCYGRGHTHQDRYVSLTYKDSNLYLFIFL